MITLGVSTMGSSAAALLEDGVALAAIEEDRLTRLKNDGGFPRLAVAQILDAAGVTLQEVDQVCVYWQPWRVLTRARGVFGSLSQPAVFRRRVGSVLSTFGLAEGRAAYPELRGRWSELFRVRAVLAADHGAWGAPIEYYDHHDCHYESVRHLRTWTRYRVRRPPALRRARHLRLREPRPLDPPLRGLHGVPAQHLVSARSADPRLGGGYLRSFPWFLMQSMLRRYLSENRLCVLFAHPFECSARAYPEIPAGTAMATRLRFALGNGTSIGKIGLLIELLREYGFEFTTFTKLRERRLESVTGGGRERDQAPTSGENGVAPIDELH